MPITTSNYASQAVRDLLLIREGIADQTSFLGKHPDVSIRTTAADNLLKLAGLIKSAHHFWLPEEGSLKNGFQFYGLRGLKLRLPYPTITLEFIGGGIDHVVLAGHNLSHPEHIQLTVLNKTEGRFAPTPASMLVPCAWEEHVIAWRDNGEVDNLETRYVKLGGIYELFARISSKSEIDIDQRITSILGSNALVVMSFCEALACSNVCAKVLEPVDQAVNRKRIAKGKLPLYETKVLVVKVPKRIQKKTPSVGTHASPREHYRMRHVRVYHRGQPNEFRIWIPPIIVNPGGPGRIDKTYAIIGVDD